MKRIRALLGRGLSVLAGTLLFALMLVTVADVLGRYLFGRPVPGAFELTQVGMALLIFTGLPLVTARDGHVTIDLFEGFGGDRIKAIRDLLVSLLSALVVGVIAWRLWVLGGRLADYGDLFEFIGLSKAWVAYVMSILSAATVAMLLSKAARGLHGLVGPKP